MYVLIRSMSVATHQVRSSGHHKLELSGQPIRENAVPAACSGPRSKAIFRCGMGISGTVPGANGVSPYPSHTPNQHWAGVAVKRASTRARLARFTRSERHTADI